MLLAMTINTCNNFYTAAELAADAIRSFETNAQGFRAEIIGRVRSVFSRRTNQHVSLTTQESRAVTAEINRLERA